MGSLIILFFYVYFRSQYIWGQGAAGAKQDEKRPSPQLVGTNMFAALDEKVSEPSSRSSSLKGTSSLTEKDKMISSYKSNVEGKLNFLIIVYYFCF